MVGRFLYLLILFFLARLLWNAVAELLAGAARRQQMGANGPSGQTPHTIHKGQMVRDPVCGLHLPESRAITETRSGERFHFCSEQCRQSFLTSS
jgi:YHS domain-containing protein